MTAPAPTTSSSSATSITNTTSAPVLRIQIHHLISVKLDNENYLLWSAQFLPLLQGYDLEGYVDGSLPCPSQFLPESTEINLAYTTWKKQDKILLGWLLSSLSEPVLAQVVGLTTSRQVWESLQKHFSSQSQARILHLKRELQNMRKGNKSMAEYYLQAKQLADKLAAAGQPISSTNLQHMMLSGLDAAYDSIVTVLTATAVELHMDDFYSNLLAFDMQLESKQAQFSLHTTNLAHRGNFKASSSGSGSKGHRDRPSHHHNKPRAFNRNQSRAPSTRSNAGPCQICNRKNHSAVQCWYRFEKDFNMPSSSADSPSTAYIADPGSLLDGNWCPDSGATHHLTSYLNNLHIRTPYDGPDRIKVGNGSDNGEATTARHE